MQMNSHERFWNIIVYIKTIVPNSIRFLNNCLTHSTMNYIKRIQTMKIYAPLH